jgi:invasion protein IalB
MDGTKAATTTLWAALAFTWLAAAAPEPKAAEDQQAPAAPTETASPGSKPAA